MPADSLTSSLTSTQLEALIWAPGQTIPLAWTIDTGVHTPSAADFIGFYRESDLNTTHYDRWLGRMSTGGAASGSGNFVVPAGLADDLYQPALCTSNASVFDDLGNPVTVPFGMVAHLLSSIHVRPTGTTFTQKVPSVGITGTSFAAAAAIPCTWANVPNANVQNVLLLYDPIGDPSASNYLAEYPTGGAASGSTSGLIMPSTPTLWQPLGVVLVDGKAGKTPLAHSVTIYRSS